MNELDDMVGKVPLFEIKGASDLVGFRTLRGGAELYESEIEDLLWANPDELTGESLFPVARQPILPEGGRPDIVCLDGQCRVVVVEIKRDIARSQLAQCLEYAGWARTTNLQELAGLYHGGHDAFYAAWQEFTESDAPAPIRQSPRLVLVAREFHGRTGSALEFLVEHGLPVLLIRVALYEDAEGRRFLDVEGDHEPDLSNSSADGGGDVTRIEGRRLRVADLLDAGFLHGGEGLVWRRPRVGKEYRSEITEDGGIRLEDGHPPRVPQWRLLRFPHTTAGMRGEPSLRTRRCTRSAKASPTQTFLRQRNRKTRHRTEGQCPAGPAARRPSDGR